MPFSSPWSPELFDKEYATLNLQQQEAVREKCVVVVGRPCTGKTYVLALRMAILLRDTTVQPENMLCLAAMETGIQDIRRHLLHWEDLDAQKVHIYSFEAFCDRVILENTPLFNQKNALLLSALERIDLLTRLIDAFPQGHPLKRYRGDVYHEIRHLPSLFLVMKQEGWTPKYISEQIDVYLRQDRTEEEMERMEKLRAAANEYPHFQALLQDGNRYEADDKVYWVIAAFETNPSLLQYYRQRFRHVLVDDYEDLTAMQRRLLALLTTGDEQPGLFITANDPTFIDYLPENMAMRLVQLTETYSNKPAAIPQVREYETGWQEMTGITWQVQQLLQQGILSQQIAVLYTERRYGQKLLSYFNLGSIPVQDNHLRNLPDESLVQKIMLVFNYLAAEQHTAGSGDEILFELLHADWFNIPPAEVALLTIQLSEQPNNNPVSLRRLLYEKVHTPARDLFSAPVHEGLQAASQAVEQLLQLSPATPLPSLLENIIDAVNLPRYILKSPDQLSLQQALTAFISLVEETARRNPSLDLQQLVKLLTLAQWEGVFLPVNGAGNNEGVRLLSLQDAKGLTFDYVFLSGCHATDREKKYIPPTGYPLPDTLVITSGRVNREDGLSSRFRIAAACAQYQLIFSYSRWGKEAARTYLPEEVMAQQALPVEAVVLPPSVMALFQELWLAETMAPAIAALEENVVGRLLEKFMLSATALNNYLYCPLQFYYQHILRVPAYRNEATEFGSAVHHALELLFRKMQADYEAFPSLAVFIDDFEQYMYRQRGSFTPDQFNRRLEYGREILSNYYREYIHSWNTIVAVERNFRNVIVQGVPLKGKIDKLEFDGRMVNIVDYKTGDPEKARLQLASPHETMPLGGNYWRQAVFYKILVDNYRQKAWKVVSSELDLVEPNRKKQYHKLKLFITAEDVATVMEQIVNTWWRIQNRDFYTGCGKPDCYWCRFVTVNKLAVTWHPLKGREH